MESYRKSGFTLIEVLIAMCVLTIGILSMYSMQMVAIKGNFKSMRLTKAVQQAESWVEKKLASPYNFLHDGSGLHSGDAGLDDHGIDTNGDGIYTIEELKNNVDGHELKKRDNFLIYWNVANDIPQQGVKKIKFFVYDIIQNKVLISSIIYKVSDNQ